MSSRRVYIISFWVGLGLSSLQGPVKAQPTGYVSSPAGAPAPYYRVDLDGDFGLVSGTSGTAEYEFGYLSALDPYQEWPVCGPGTSTTSPRIPISGDGSFIVSSSATTTFPNAFDNTPGPKYLKDNNTANPVYAYRRSGGNRCACLSDKITSPTSLPTYSAVAGRVATDYSLSPQRFLGSTYEDISGANSASFSSPAYGPVAISNVTVGDPREFSRFHPASGAPAYSVCSCPNINEKATSLNSSDSRYGSMCSPMISDVPAGIRVLAPYADFLTYYQPHIMTSWKEQTTASLPLATSVLLPKSSDLGQTERYNRRIWTCSAPYEPNTGTGTCEYSRQKHACGESSTGVVLSPYGESSDTASNTNFQKLANKKLACCLNSHAVSSAGATQQSFLKYDCLQTKEVDASGARLDFNALWAGGDDTQDGGQMNALALVSAVGQPITGFYSLRGTRCGKFSEFGGELRPKRVQPFLVANQQVTVAGGSGIENIGAVYALPSGTAYQNLKAGINKGIPSTLQEMNDCPILVRAALVVSCPSSNAGNPPDLRLQDPTDGTLVRCPMAASITVHLRIEQLYQIAGQSPLKTFDTRAMKDQIASLDVSEIIGNRFGDTCLPGTRRLGDICTY